MGMNYLKNVTTLKLITERCVGCGLCAEVCPHGVLFMDNKKVQIVNKDLCMECGGCAKNCPVSAISVHAGVGCAGAVILGFFGKKGGCNCNGSAKCEKAAV
jgi:NAD-dependent dihydropyrimidine dehydrogenase PreA subunit